MKKILSSLVLAGIAALASVTAQAAGTAAVTLPSFGWVGAYNNSKTFTDPTPAGMIVTSVKVSASVQANWLSATQFNLNDPVIGGTVMQTGSNWGTETFTFNGSPSGFVKDGTNTLSIYSWWNGCQMGDVTLTFGYITVDEQKALEADLQAQLTQCDDLCTNLQTKLNTANTQVTSLQQQLATANATNATLSSSLDAANAQLAANAATIATLKQNLATATTQAATLQASLTTANANLTAANAQIAQLQATVATLTATNAALQSSLDAANAKIAALSSSLDASNAQVASLTTQVTTLTSDLTTAKGTVAQQAATIDGLNAQITAANTQTTALTTSLATLFNDPSFTIAGSTPSQQLQTLVTAISNLNYGQKQALYKNLGGTKK
jgi:predicted  nucleic acid-binding Zn-ribbon protein